MDGDAELELDLAEELVIGLAGEEFGDLAEIVLGRGIERLEKSLIATGLFIGQTGERQGNRLQTSDQNFANQLQ